MIRTSSIFECGIMWATSQCTASMSDIELITQVPSRSTKVALKSRRRVEAIEVLSSIPSESTRRGGSMKEILS